MAQDSARRSSLPISQSPLFPPRTLIQSNLQWHSDPERSLGRQESPGPSRKPSLPRHPGPPTLGTQSVHPSHQMPSNSPVSSGCESSLGPMVGSEKHGDQQVCHKGLRKQRKQRIVYSHEQKLLLLEHFDQFRYPDLEQRVKLALLIGVTEYEIEIWFKNQRARCKREELKNVKEALPESTGSSQDDSVPTHSHGFQMAQDSARKSSLPMSQSPLFPPRTLMQSNLQWHSDPERSLGRQESLGQSRKLSLPRHPGPPMLGTQSVHPIYQMPSSSPVSSGFESSLGPMVGSEKYGDQQVCRKGPRKQQKERTVYSREQKLLLLEHFDQFRYPDLEQRVKLALLIGVTEYEIKIWFKNQRARCKREELKNVKEALPESTGSSQDVSVPTHSHGQLSVTANVGSLSPGTSTVGSIPNLKPSIEVSLNNDQAVEDEMCSSQEDLLVGQAPATTANPGKPTVVEVQTDPAVTDGRSSVEASVSTTTSPRSPDVVQYLHPSSEQL